MSERSEEIAALRGEVAMHRRELARKLQRLENLEMLARREMMQELGQLLQAQQQQQPQQLQPSMEGGKPDVGTDS